ncbi:Nicotinamidase-related amidase [Onishia taeanensis]|uniref:Nicotinamidase-related amidase n=1 Tax=Onishia taeanensis TaxID=284577 RepID=A0A1G7VEG8_9GAMM|nr:isochorismatase family protein [Halomonas taeanensis]SDG57330.1 Nicotinamidase-related amidase [Halomonas taeanensis]
MRLDRTTSLLLIVDLQTGLLPVIEGGEQAVTEAAWLAGLSRMLDVPVWLTEQYPAGLGSVDARLLASAPDALRWEKVHFDAHAEPPFAKALAELGRKQVVICGSEAHICVLQTALGLLAADYRVYWLAEACASRRHEEARLARERVTAAGGVVISADMAAYEWLERCDNASFKEAHREFLKPRAARLLHF